MSAPEIAELKRLDDASALARDEIHVWSLELGASLPPYAVAAAAAAALRRLLCAYAKLSVPPLIERGVHGKPFAPALGDLEFNLSHAGGHALFGFARGQALGVDLECLDRRVSLTALARRFFASDEADALQRLSPEKQHLCFFQLWTHKEAVLKAIGQGLNFGLDRLAFAIDADGGVGRLLRIDAEAGDAAEWRSQQLPAGPGLMAALAWRGPPRRIRLFAPP